MSSAGAETEPKRSRRPYLRADARRRQLLDAAARLAGRDGLDRLTMVGVASEAGVSRQLVYEHFADLPSLASALVADRFGRVDATIARAIEEPHARQVSVALLAARLLLAQPAEERHLVRALLAHASVPGHELSSLAVRLRARMIKRWSDALGTGQSRRARAGVWALLQAIFGLADLVDAGEVPLEDALAQFETLLRAAFPAAR